MHMEKIKKVTKTRHARGAPKKVHIDVYKNSKSSLIDHSLPIVLFYISFFTMFCLEKIFFRSASVQEQIECVSTWQLCLCSDDHISSTLGFGLRTREDIELYHGIKFVKFVKLGDVTKLKNIRKKLGKPNETEIFAFIELEWFFTMLSYSKETP